MDKMDSKKVKKAVDVLSKEKGIDEDIIYDAMELALTSAYKKNYHSLSNVRVDINRATGEIKIFSLLEASRQQLLCLLSDYILRNSKLSF